MNFEKSILIRIFYFIRADNPNIAIMRPDTTKMQAHTKKEIDITEVRLFTIVSPKYVKTKASAILAIILDTIADSSLA
jgi:hypothetical protein